MIYMRKAVRSVSNPVTCVTCALDAIHRPHTCPILRHNEIHNTLWQTSQIVTKCPVLHASQNCYYFVND